MQDSGLTCPACGGPNEPGTAICTWCGNPLAHGAAPAGVGRPPGSPAPPRPGPPPPPPPQRPPQPPPQPVSTGQGAKGCLTLLLGCVGLIVVGFIVIIIIGAIATAIAPSSPTPRPHATPHRAHR